MNRGYFRLVGRLVFGCVTHRLTDDRGESHILYNAHRHDWQEGLYALLRGAEGWVSNGSRKGAL